LEFDENSALFGRMYLESDGGINSDDEIGLRPWVLSVVVGGKLEASNKGLIWEGRSAGTGVATPQGTSAASRYSKLGIFIVAVGLPIAGKDVRVAIALH